MDQEFNLPELITRRQSLRSTRTPAEGALWKSLKNRQIAGLRFRRQFSVGPFILDFYCPALHLAIELDGQSHVGKEEYDERRTAFLEARGITVLRYENRTVFENAEQIYMDIEAFLAKACARGMEVETVRQIKNPSVTPITPHEY